MTYGICDCQTCTNPLKKEEKEKKLLEETKEIIQKLDKEPNAMKRAKIMAAYLTKKRK
jgi:hypothetical protein